MKLSTSNREICFQITHLFVEYWVIVNKLPARKNKVTPDFQLHLTVYFHSASE